jgi:hypothetical protein
MSIGASPDEAMHLAAALLRIPAQDQPNHALREEKNDPATIAYH